MRSRDRRIATMRITAAIATARDNAASRLNTISQATPRDRTGAAGIAAGPPPKCALSGEPA
jgi:hypothetical protein